MIIAKEMSTDIIPAMEKVQPYIYWNLNDECLNVNVIRYGCKEFSIIGLYQIGSNGEKEQAPSHEGYEAGWY